MGRLPTVTVGQERKRLESKMAVIASQKIEAINENDRN